MCVWLGMLASWRPGLVGQLLRRYRTTATVLRQDPREIMAFAGRGTPDGQSVADDGGGAAADARVSDASRFDTLLRAGPQSCLLRAERRQPGDLVVAWSEALYPDQLRDLPDPPLCLFVRGGADSDSARRRLSAIADGALVAVVGARTPSPYGEDMARRVAGDLARRGVVIVSGLAMGIDAAAQTAAVEAGASAAASGAVPAGPSTVSVLGCGPDVIYPRHNARLYARVVGSGIVVSEFAWGVPARRWRFPARNRIMAALARAVVFVEGTRRSGGRITVAHAADLGREVLCVPGEAGRRLSEAPNRLLDDGASVCESATDVLRALRVADPGVVGSGDDAGPLAPDHGGKAVRDVLSALQDASLTIDELARRCHLPVAKAAAAVSDLEVEGLARRVEGGRYRIYRI